MSMKWVCGARRAMLASICTSAFAVSGQALAQDVPATAVPDADAAAPASVETHDTAATGTDSAIRRRTSEIPVLFARLPLGGALGMPYIPLA